ncbi:MAG: hemerythrin domain-containing protein, partial [Pseudomonadota bacterium]
GPARRMSDPLPPLHIDRRIIGEAHIPEEWLFLAKDHPRETWMANTALGETTKFWLSVHRHFRQMGAHLDRVGNDYREGNVTADEFQQRLAPRLQQFLATLDHHHRIEDHHFFPVFTAAEPRLADGIDLLEADHETIDAQVHAMVDVANHLLQTPANDSEALKRNGAAFADASERIVALLKRHLDDEEEIIVPLFLDRGEVALLGDPT